MGYEATSFKTKSALSDSLKKIMEQKPVSKITISEITEACGFNRKTFYYHFKDISDLLKWTIEHEAVSTVKQYGMNGDYKKAVDFTIDYVSRNRHLLNCVYSSIGRDELRRFFWNDFRDIVAAAIAAQEKTLNIKLSESFREFAADFYAEAFTGQIIRIFRDHADWDREEISGYISLMVSSALPGILRAAEEKKRSAEKG
ncbi:MAG: TetR/AcrR family transcriptional regulator C-terminal domain-containing protein [Porcipelethomonas sp.]